MSLKYVICCHDATMQPRRVTRHSWCIMLILQECLNFGTMLEYSTGKLLARAAFMQNEDQRHDALRHDDAFKGLTMV